MKSVKKNIRTRKTKKLVPVMILLITILAISIAFLVYVHTQNYITVENIDKSSSKIKSDEVSLVSPIIINNVVVGGVTDKGKFVSKDNMFGKANISKGAEIDMYSKTGKMGTFEIYSTSEDGERKISYAMPLADVSDEEYIALGKSDNNIMIRQMVKVDKSENDIKSVKKALGMYKLLNNTVKVNEVYEVYLGKDQKSRVITATSTGKNIFGVYSVVVVAKGNNAEIVKYSYVKNTESSVNWPIYSIKFACDLNNDDSYELVIQEARELTMKYSILENKNNKYYEVIGLEFKI